jgi:hypothetical protein
LANIGKQEQLKMIIGYKLSNWGNEDLRKRAKINPSEGEGTSSYPQILKA